MDHVPLMSEVMTPFPHWIDLGESLVEARRRMRELDVHHLPVKQEGSLVGILSSREVDLALAAAAGLPAEDELTVRAACVVDPWTADIHASLDGVLHEMAERGRGSVLVTKEERLAGIFTTHDACRHFAKLLRTLFPSGGDHVA